MSYKQESHQIMAGSLNLLPPGEKIPDGDCRELCNWRMDQQGMLRSRGGVAAVFALLSGPGQSMGRWASLYYWQSGTALNRNAYPMSLDGWVVLNLGGSPPLNSPGDGNPFFFAAMNGFMFIMNRNLQACDDGTTFSTWGIQPPATAPFLSGLDFVAYPAGAVAGGAYNLLGDYTWFVTFATADSALESNPSPGSGPTGEPQVYFQATLTIPVSPDPKVTQRNIYRNGGTLGSTYLVGSVTDNVTTTFTDNLSDLAATTMGIILQINHDPPPAASGIVGPYFGAILAWSSAANVNRLWWTLPELPGYFPGSQSDDSATGNWVDVGDDGEAILNITVHSRLAIIYKERSIWRLIGDPNTGYLEQTKATVGPMGPKCVTNAGGSDYFACSDGIFSFDMDTPTKVSPGLDPILRAVDPATFVAPLIQIPSIEPSQRPRSAMALYNGEIYFSYPETGQTTPTAMLVYDIASGRWGRATYTLSAPAASFAGLLYPGGAATAPALWGLDQNGGIYALDTGTTDYGGAAIPLLFQSGYYNQGAPDNDKVYTSLVIDFQMFEGDSLDVSTYFNSGAGWPGDGGVGTLTGVGGRVQTEFTLGEDNEGLTARSISVRLEGDCFNEVFIYSITLYYYTEARLATLVNTIPIDGGTSKVKQIRALELDINTSPVTGAGGAASADVSTDLPGNAITAQTTLAIAQSNGRRNFQLPFPETYEGRLLQLSVYSESAFRLYAARILMRVVGVYVEDYEAAAGFVWDSYEQDFSSHITHVPRGVLISLHANPIKRARELEVEIETRGDGAITVVLLTDLPGEAMAPRYSQVVQATGGRRIVRLPLPVDAPGQALNANAIEGRLYELQIFGNATYILYGARIDILPIGVYIEAYEASGGAVYDSRETDFGSQKVKDARELQLDIETSGPATVNLYGDAHGKMTLRFTGTVDTTLTTPGRRKVNLALTAAGQPPELDARLWQLQITGTNAFRLYAAALHVRAIGHYIDTDAATGASLYDSTPLALGPPAVKQFKTLEVELDTQGPVTLAFLTDLPQNSLAQQLTQTIDTTGQGRRTFQIPLPQGTVPDSYLFGKLMQLLISGTSAYKLFGARVEMRTVGVYVEAYEAAAGAVWDSSPLDLGEPGEKVFDQLRFEMDADGACSVTVWTDLPGETLTPRFTAPMSTTGFGRRWVTVVLPADTRGRLIQVIVSSNLAFRLYQGQIAKRIIGRYLSAAQNDVLRSLGQDFGTELVKLFKKLEVDIQTDGPVPLTLYTDQPSGTLTAAYSTTLNTGPNNQAGPRQTLLLRLPGNIRGRIAMVQIGGGSNSARLFAVRAWTRTVGEAQAGTWEWGEFPVEKSEALAAWVALPVAPTPAEWTWTDLPVEATPAEFTWAQFAVLPTSAQWDWAVFPVEETPSEWTWQDIPMGPGS